MYSGFWFKLNLNEDTPMPIIDCSEERILERISILLCPITSSSEDNWSLSALVNVVAVKL